MHDPPPELLLEVLDEVEVLVDDEVEVLVLELVLVDVLELVELLLEEELPPPTTPHGEG